MKKQTSQDFFTSPCPWNEGLIIDHLSNEFGKTQGDMRDLKRESMKSTSAEAAQTPATQTASTPKKSIA